MGENTMDSLYNSHEQFRNRIMEDLNKDLSSPELQKELREALMEEDIDNRNEQVQKVIHRMSVAMVERKSFSKFGAWRESVMPAVPLGRLSQNRVNRISRINRDVISNATESSGSDE